MGTQTEIAAHHPSQGGGDYLLALKDNWPATLAEVEKPSSPIRRRHRCERSETTDADHGRIEVRRHAVCHDVDWLFSDRRYPGRGRLPGPGHDRHGREPHRARRQDRAASGATISAPPSSMPRPSPVPCAPIGASRTGSIGSSDVVFHDDLARLRTGHGPANMAVVKHMAMNLVRHPKDITASRTAESSPAATSTTSKASSEINPR